MADEDGRVTTFCAGCGMKRISDGPRVHLRVCADKESVTNDISAAYVAWDRCIEIMVHEKVGRCHTV